MATFRCSEKLPPLVGGYKWSEDASIRDWRCSWLDKNYCNVSSVLAREGLAEPGLIELVRDNTTRKHLYTARN